MSAIAQHEYEGELIAGFLSLYDDTETVDLSDLVDAAPGTWVVKIKKCLTNRDMDAAKESLSRLIDGRAHPDMANYQRALVVAAIVDWNLTDASDTPLALTPEKARWSSVESLPEQVFTRIYQKVQENNSDREGDEQRTFRSGSDRGNTNGSRRSPRTQTPLVAQGAVDDRAEA